MKKLYTKFVPNAPCHTAISVIEFLAKKDIPVVPQPHTPLI